jgi:hypothetical protein
VTVRVVPASQSQEQALKVRMAGKLVHERPELLVRGVLDGGWRHHCTSIHEQENCSAPCATYPDWRASRFLAGPNLSGC